MPEEMAHYQEITCEDQNAAFVAMDRLSEEGWIRCDEHFGYMIDALAEKLKPFGLDLEVTDVVIEKPGIYTGRQETYIRLFEIERNPDA